MVNRAAGHDRVGHAIDLKFVGADCGSRSAKDCRLCTLATALPEESVTTPNSVARYSCASSKAATQRRKYSRMGIRRSMVVSVSMFCKEAPRRLGLKMSC